jgi:hypothetical protein
VTTTGDHQRVDDRGAISVCDQTNGSLHQLDRPSAASRVGGRDKRKFQN